MLKLYTRFYVQERFSWSSFVICINFSSFSLWQIIFLYFLLGTSCIWIHSIFLIWLVPRTAWKGLLYSFKFNLKNRGVLIFTHYQYFWVFLSEKFSFVPRLLYQPIYSINRLSQKSNHQIVIPFADKTWDFTGVHI